MFSAEDLAPCLQSEWLTRGASLLDRLILTKRLGLNTPIEPLDSKTIIALERFSQAVLASVGDWENPRSGIPQQLCIRAADIEAGLDILKKSTTSVSAPSSHVLRAALLYDMVGMPSAAASVARRDGLPEGTRDFFARTITSQWGALGNAIDEPGPVPEATGEWVLINLALSEVLAEISRSFQSGLIETHAALASLKSLQVIASSFSMGVEADVFQIVSQLLELRLKFSTLLVLANIKTLPATVLRALRAPTELWPAQKLALQNGLLNNDLQSFGLASPTGTGKTASAKLVLADFFASFPGSKAIYISPSRALTSQIAHDLTRALKPLGLQVLGLGSHLTFHELIPNPEDADILVFTPEKADLLLRINPQTMKAVRLVIVDEAHHIEVGTRGILLEFYLWRLRAILGPRARIVQLSAVTPNISEIVSWLGQEGSQAAVQVEWRTNRLRLGIFEPRENGSAVIQFGDEQPFIIFGPGEMPEEKVQALAALANRLSTTGTVLVLATSVGQAEKIADAVGKLREPHQEPNDDISERFDARVERELYSESPLRELFRRRVAFHHAQLPPRVRTALEDLISHKKIDVVCATTTLAEGVNFPFSTVIVESLVGRDFELTPRALWNIAGRAGRFGVDSEGHCILFNPSSWVKKLKKFRLTDYMQVRLQDIPPVRSALATAISELEESVDLKRIDFDELEEISLVDLKSTLSPTEVKHIRGLVNVLRVGYAHATASGVINIDDNDAPEFDGVLLASRQLDAPRRRFAKRLAIQQRSVVQEAIQQNDELVAIAARIGWSLETQSVLYDWIQSLPDWRLQQYGQIVVGGKAQIPRLSYLIGPVAKRMAEFEGEKLGGFTSFIADKWIEGVPLTEIRNAQTTKPDFGRLVRIIYSRVQYLLPWALFGVNELLKLDATRRGISIEDGVKDLSVLAAEGVPSFDAFQLVVQLGLERVDAARLASHFHSSSRGTSVLDWFRSSQWETLVAIVRGSDRRRLDPDLRGIWDRLNSGDKSESNLSV